jgi:hypothetical protein
MDKIGDFFSKAGELFRDIFSYLIPSVTFVLLAIPLLKAVGWLDPKLFNYDTIISYSSALGIVFIVVIFYTIGRILFAFSYPVIFLIEMLTRVLMFITEMIALLLIWSLWKPVSVIKGWSRPLIDAYRKTFRLKPDTIEKQSKLHKYNTLLVREMIINKKTAEESNEYRLCHLALKHGMQEYYYLFERRNFIHNSENSFCACFFILGILLSYSILACKMAAALNTSFLFCVLSFGMSVLFYYMTLCSYGDLTEMADFLNNEEGEPRPVIVTKPRKKGANNYFVLAHRPYYRLNKKPVIKEEGKKK